MKHNQFLVKSGKRVRLADFDPAYTAQFSRREEAAEKLEKDVGRLRKYQDILYAQNTHALLVIFQAMDAAGKDSVIKHVMSGVNPQGTQVFSFKAPSTEELDHDYLWRHTKALPERGRIGIFNRSYYEEVLVVRVHPEILNSERLPPECLKGIWKKRFEQINNFERYLVENGIHVLKFYLNVSKAEQKRRFLARIERPEKNWKFSLADVKDRAHWNDYMKAYEEALRATSTKWAPWYVVPADNKWFTHLAVAGLIIAKLKSLKLAYPKVSEQHLQELMMAKEALEDEPS
jgi:PPK2 family polyphosphate:nucleotide phosphotransferase